MYFLNIYPPPLPLEYDLYTAFAVNSSYYGFACYGKDLPHSAYSKWC